MTGNRGLKNRTAISTAISNDIYKQLKEYSDKSFHAPNLAIFQLISILVFDSI